MGRASLRFLLGNILKRAQLVLISLDLRGGRGMMALWLVSVVGDVAVVRNKCAWTSSPGGQG
jgi:hypothetical protein